MEIGRPRRHPRASHGHRARERSRRRSPCEPDAGAANTAEQYPQYAQPIVQAARTSFLDGGDWTYAAGMIAVAIGIAVVFFLFPKKDDEQQMLAEYAAEDA